MGLLSRLSIAAKISLIPAIAIGIFVVYLVITAMAGSKNAKLLDYTQTTSFPVLRASDRLLFGLERLSEQYMSAVTTGEQEPLENARKTYVSLTLDLEVIAKLIGEKNSKPREINRQLENYNSMASSLANSMLDGTADFSKLGQQSTQMNQLYASLREEVQAFQSDQLVAFKSQFTQIEESAKHIVDLGFVLGVIACAILLVVTLPVVFGIRKNLNSVIESLKAIAEGEGDLTVRLRSTSGDEIGDLVYWFNSFVDKLQRVVRQVVETSAPLNQIAEQLDNVASHANDSIDEQRSGTTRAKNSIGEMSASVTEVADSATLAAEAAEEATRTAKEGQSTVLQTVTSIRKLAENVTEIQTVIHRLDEDSNRVGSVLDVIKGIAEQTNLLALNAAIEAARAGEQGRGFAVVADEVRTLASRTQESTDEIRNTIEKLQSAAMSAVKVMEESAKQADQSVENANKAGDSLDGIHNSITNINQMNNNIAHSTNEQSRVAADIVEIINSIHAASANTSERSQRLVSVSKELMALATAMSGINRQFKV